MKQLETVTFASPPTMFAAWPGMGNVGLISVDYLRRTLGARSFAELDMSPFFIPDSIIVKDGIAQLPDIPSAIFYYCHNPDIIIFESNAQVGGREGITIIKTILDIAAQYRTPHIFTSAAFAQPMSHTDQTQVLAACNKDTLLETVLQYGVKPMPDGYIAGLNGLLLGIAASRYIESACFLGTIPTYATNISYPKASLEIIKVISQITNTPIDLTELEESVLAMDQQLATIEERIKQYFPGAGSEADEEISAIEEEKVPHYIMEKIERLFAEAKRDRSKATELKKELDRWNIYELYENRFLDLFEEGESNKR